MAVELWPLIVSLVYSVTAHVLAYKMIFTMKDNFMKAGMFGKDLNKTSEEKVPEGLGVVTGAVFLICTFLFIPIPFLDYSELQLRIHSSTNCVSYIHVVSRCIIEDSTSLQFTPYKWSYPGQDEHYSLSRSINNWDKIDDFIWLSIKEHSPNWSLLSPEESQHVIPQNDSDINEQFN